MNKNFEIKLNQFLNDETYIVAYRFNYDPARIFTSELIDYIKELQQENKELKERINKLSQWDTNKDTRLSRQRIVIKNLLEENKQLKEKIDKAIKLLENSQLYCARAIGKTLFAEVMNREIRILKGEKNEY